MNKLFLIFVLILIPMLSIGAEKELTAAWRQVLPEPNDLSGWKLYKGTTSGGPYGLEKTINYVVEQSIYEDIFPVTVPDKQVTILYFVLTAFDINGNESGYSNEASIRIDFKPPDGPYELRFKIVTVP